MQRGVSLTRTAVRYRIGNVALTAGAAEHRLNIGAVAVDICHHHHDIARRQLRILLQHRQQAIVQHLHFPLRAVADMHRNAAIFWIERAFLIAARELLCRDASYRAVLQLKDVVFQVLQQRAWGDVDKGIQLFIALHTCQQKDVVAPQLAPGGQQWVTHILLPFAIEQTFRALRIAEKRKLAVIPVMTAAARDEPCEKRRVFDIAPVVATGVSKQQMHINMFAQRLQGLQVDRRQRGDAADKDARRQPGRRLFRRFKPGDKALIEVGAVPVGLA